MDSAIAYSFALIFVVIALNFYFVFIRMRRNNRNKKNTKVPAVQEEQQAMWRDKEIVRRLEREQDYALKRIRLRNETLALYEEVRRRHAEEDSLLGN
ncbi:MAG: hypothetical protein LBD23_16320 [Oscillospiraceae bacterium]|nr:hypothetical protein [Oscillospiraceae bacterium]